jgi:hypothetical protein
MRRFLLGAVAALAVAVALPAMAYDNVVTIPSSYPTYSAIFTGLTPAASPTDILTLSGSSNPSLFVHVRHVSCFGASTANGADLVELILRSTANTGGTSAAVTPTPYDSRDPTSTATVAKYTANPASLGTSLGIVRAGLLGTTVLASSGPSNAAIFDMARDSATDKDIIIKPGNFLAINGAATSFQAGSSIGCEVVWTERPT